MKAKLEIDMDNAAFDDEGAATELGRILRKLAEEIENTGAGAFEPHTLRDMNGNAVGVFAVED